MTEPRRTDDVRLSTADLANATDRAKERATEKTAAQNPAEPAPPKLPAQPPVADRDDNRPSSLFAGNEADDFRHQWGDIQTGFVDEPRQAVERADALVAAAMKRLAEIFAQERSKLEQQWARGGDVSTEDLRVAFRRYRGFFDRLLSV